MRRLILLVLLFLTVLWKLVSFISRRMHLPGESLS